MISICLTNPKSPTNVGGVMRASGCFGVDQVFYTGNRYNKAKKFATDTQDIAEDIGLVHVQEFLSEKAPGQKVICVDLVEGATPLPAFEHPENAMYIFGPEDGSLSQEIIDAADEVVFMPSRGSLNLAASVNVLLYDRVAKDPTWQTDDALVKQSRDKNNNLKVK